MAALQDLMLREQTSDPLARADVGMEVPRSPGWAKPVKRTLADVMKGADSFANDMLNPKSGMDILKWIDQRPEIAQWLTMNMTPPGQMIQGSRDVSEAIQSEAPWQNRLAQGAAGVLGMATAPLGVDVKLAGKAARGLNKLDDFARSGELMRPLQNEYGVFVGPGAKGWEELPGKFSSLADRMERAEIDDSGARMASSDTLKELSGVPWQLSKFLEHPKLYERYPGLQEEVTMLDIVPGSSMSGSYVNRDTVGSGWGGIRMTAPDAEIAKKGLLHEIQHAIQEKEGWASGGSPSGISDEFSSRAIQLGKEIQDIRSGKTDTDIQTLMELEDEKRRLDHLLNFPYKAYKRLAGEIEARDVASRANLSPEQRASTPPYSSEDIPLEDWIVRKGGGGASMSIDDPDIANAPWQQGQIEGYVDDPVERQKNFDNWFGDSKVVDESGKPLTVYHTSPYDFDAFDTELNGGSHFGTENAAKQAAKYNRKIKYRIEEDSGKFYVVPDNGPNEGKDVGEFARRSEAKSFIKQQPSETPIYKVNLRLNNPKMVDDAGVAKGWEFERNKAIEEGHDGLMYKNEVEDKGGLSYVAFDPTQIKSIFNRGTYDPKDPRILYGAMPLASMAQDDDNDPVIQNAPWRR